MQTGQDRPEDAILGMKHIKGQFEDQLKLIKSTGKNAKSAESIEKMLTIMNGLEQGKSLEDLTDEEAKTSDDPMDNFLTMMQSMMISLKPEVELEKEELPKNFGTCIKTQEELVDMSLMDVMKTKIFIFAHIYPNDKYHIVYDSRYVSKDTITELVEYASNLDSIVNAFHEMNGEKTILTMKFRHNYNIKPELVEFVEILNLIYLSRCRYLRDDPEYEKSSRIIEYTQYDHTERLKSLGYHSERNHAGRTLVVVAFSDRP